MPRILVTGGAGFIGANLCRKLVKDKSNRVVCIDDLSSGRRENIAELIGLPNFEFIRHDVTEPFDAQVDQIYNAACRASPPAYQSDPVHTTKTCVLGAINMLELARKYGAKLFQFSTSEVYGEPEVHPQVETYRGNVNPIGIRACYDEGKRCAETLCFDYNRMYGVKIKVIRIFNTYGPYMDPKDGRVVSNFIMQALRGEDLTVYGDGTQTRSFQYIDDLLEGIDRMMNRSRDDFLGPVNLGNPHEFTMLELAEKVLKKTGSRSSIRHLPLPSDDPTHRRPDIGLAKKELGGWEPTVQLDEGLERSIEYFKTRL
ncbi:MAG: SDR family oxidoreductase [Oscillospiraceae bacterium]|nr:SDR family oxidoreductase [Oscillospiraceae bacterium]